MNAKFGMLLAVVLAACGSQIGCAQISQLSDEDLAAYVNIGSEKATEYGLKLAVKKFPEKAAAIQKDAVVIAGVIDDTVLKMFDSSTGEVLRSTVSKAAELLTGKIATLKSGPELADTVKLTIDIVSLNIKLPKNPAEKLDDRTKGALLAFFRGVSKGVKAAFAPAPAGSSTAPPGLVFPDNP
jgi:hypothetical protein